MLPSGKLTELAGISPFSVGNSSSIRLHFPASYVSLPERNLERLKGKKIVEKVAKTLFTDLLIDSIFCELT